MKFGIRQNYKISSVTTISWSAFAPATDVTPDTDTQINISQAKSIAIQIDTTDADNVSDDNDINVEATHDNTNWDSVPFAEKNIGDNEIKTFLIEPGPKSIRLRADNNHASDNAAITCRIFTRE